MLGRPSSLLGVAAATLALGLTLAPARADAAVDRAATWLASQQQTNGAFGSDSSPADATAEAIATLRSAGVIGRTIELGLSHLEANGPARAKAQAAYAARIILGLVAADQNPRAFRGTDYVTILRGFEDPVTGRHGGNLFAEAIVGLARIAVGLEISDRTLAVLRASQCGSGGYGYEIGCAGKPDVDTTSLIVTLYVHVRVPANDASLADAVAWLRAQQDDRGAFPFSAGQSVNANSTGLAASAIAALGPRWTGRPAGSSLEQFVDETTGGYRYQRDGLKPNLYATIQAIPGAFGMAYPLAGAASISAGASPRSSTAPEQRAAPGGARSTTPGATPTLDVLPTDANQSASPQPRIAPAEDDLTAASSSSSPVAPIAFGGLFLAAVGSLIFRISRGRFSA